MRAFILGAGASHSYDASPTRVRPPLANGLFDAFRQLHISADRHVLIGSIVNYVRDTRGIHPLEFGNWEENIETFLSEIDEQISTPERAASLALIDRVRLDKAYNEMVFLFAAILNEIQNGPVCSAYGELVASLEPGDVLITFNWDTLLDRALWETRHWSPTDGYGLAFDGFFDNAWADSAGPTGSANCLLKLHGSTNWLIPYRALHLETCERRFVNPHLSAGEPRPYCFVRSARQYATYMDRSRSGYEPFSYYYYPPDLPIDAPVTPTDGCVLVAIVSAYDLPEHGEVSIGGYPGVSMPFIVPPVRTKDYKAIPDTLDPLWEQAETALAACDALAIIGYSFPETDVRAWDLIATACEKRSRSLPITVVDPLAERLAERLASRLGRGCRLSVLGCRFDEYIRGGYYTR